MIQQLNILKNVILHANFAQQVQLIIIITNVNLALKDIYTHTVIQEIVII